MPDDPRSGATSFVRTGDTWLGYALMGYFSFFVNVLGPLMPFLRGELDMSYTLASLHFSAFAGARVLTGLVSDRLIARFGRHRVAWGGVFGTAVGGAMLVFARHPALTIAGTAFMGALGASIPVIIQAALADRHGPLRAVAFAEANAVGSGVATLAPLCIGLFARSVVGWRGALVLAVLTPLPLFAAFRRQTLPGGPRRRYGAGSGAATGPAPGSLPPAFWAYWGVMLLVVATEFCLVYWASAFLEQVKGLPRADAALSTSVFLGGMLVGRASGSRILRRTQSRRMLLMSLGLAGLGFFLHWLAGPLLLSQAGLLLAGLGVANLYPLALTFGMGAAGQQLDAASARASLAVSLAVLCLPLLLGRLADAAGLQRAYGLVAVLLALSTVAVPLARWLEVAPARVGAAAFRPRRP